MGNAEGMQDEEPSVQEEGVAGEPYRCQFKAVNVKGAAKATLTMILKVVIVALAWPVAVSAQGTFQNLNFESADLASIPPGQSGGEEPLLSAIPSWTGYLGNVQISECLQNNYTLGTASIDIFGPQWQRNGPGIIEGNYTIMLQAGVTAGPVNTSIAQSGEIPANAGSLQFRAWELYGANSFSVSFAGNSLSIFLLGTGQSPSGQPYDIYGANISQFEGQIGQLEFTSVYNSTDPSLLLDDIAFSPQSIPEPSPLVLTEVGAIAFALYRRFTRH
jgi:hypothetical protein